MAEDLIKKYLGDQKTLSVSQFLEILNQGLASYTVTVTGEVVSFQRRGAAVYFSLKDQKDNAILSCFMWQRDLQTCGINLEDGLEILVYGIPQIYKPTGRMTFQVKIAQLVGEGALKKAYLELKAKLEKEGLFSPEQKKEIPARVKNIGLITSRTGAVVHDFLNNLGKFGFSIELFDVHVEGIHSLSDIKKALAHFKNKDIDVVVIIRGGGSLESFAAFNNEILVREIAAFPIPIIAGLGHDQDVPLAALAADAMTSTPTAITALLNTPWQELRNEIKTIERFLLNVCKNTINTYILKIKNAEQKLLAALYKSKQGISRIIESYLRFKDRLKYEIKRKSELLLNIESTLEARDPHKLLQRGYSIIRKQGGVVKSIKSLSKNDEIIITLSDGEKHANIG